MASTTAVNDIVQQAEAMFHQGQYATAAELLSDAISNGASALLWNDWAAVQVTLGQLHDAERGFCAALQLDSSSTQAMENLGALLFARGCHAEAARYCVTSCRMPMRTKGLVIENMLVACSRSGDSLEVLCLAPVPGVPGFAVRRIRRHGSVETLGQFCVLRPVVPLHFSRADPRSRRSPGHQLD